MLCEELLKSIKSIKNMVEQKKVDAEGVKFFILDKDTEVAHAFLYILRNDLHEKPFGFMEDVFVHEEYRGRGYAKEILEDLLNEARKRGCYKVVGTSRFEREKVHALYEGLSFRKQGIEFRLDIDE